MAQDRALLSVEDVSVSYGRVRAVRSVSLDVRAGQTVAVVGANGAGKTSLLSAISGARPPEGGSVWFAGEAVEGRPAHEIARRGLIHVHEGRGVFPTLSIEDNLRLVGEKATDQRRRLVADLFPFLEERSGQAAGSLSGGQQQMLALALALLSAPELMAIDEPSLGLAPILAQQVLKTLRRINREEGVALLIVEQYLHLVLGFADRVYVLEKGALVFEGSPEELLEAGVVHSSYLGGTDDDRAGVVDGIKDLRPRQPARVHLDVSMRAMELRMLEERCAGMEVSVSDFVRSLIDTELGRGAAPGVNGGAA